MQASTLQPNWPAPKKIRAYITLRSGGHSEAPFDSFNLAQHVGDNSEHVAKNRMHLQALCKLPSEPLWLRQTHSTIVITPELHHDNIEADASIAREPGVVLAVMTADCVPILICNQQGTEIAAVHAGWRGLCDGIIEQTCKQLQSPRATLLAYLGPAIGPQGFHVDNDVRAAFLNVDPSADLAFTAIGNNRYQGDLWQIARQRLAKVGVTAIYGGQHCTFSQEDQFFSYRREGQTGRMASLIWID